MLRTTFSHFDIPQNQVSNYPLSHTTWSPPSRVFLSKTPWQLTKMRFQLFALNRSAIAIVKTGQHGNHFEIPSVVLPSGFSPPPHLVTSSVIHSGSPSSSSCSLGRCLTSWTDVFLYPLSDTGTDSYAHRVHSSTTTGDINRFGTCKSPVSMVWHIYVSLAMHLQVLLLVQVFASRHLGYSPGCSRHPLHLNSVEVYPTANSCLNWPNGAMHS